MNNIVSFSGGKDSTAMLLMMLVKGEPIHSVVWFDTGWEFPQMHEHIKQVEEYIGFKIIRLNPKKSFEYWMFSHQIRNKKTGEIHRIGNGWPSPSRRWCTREKVKTIHKYSNTINKPVNCIGFAADEWYRRGSKSNSKRKIRYPLIEWGITEKQALEYCLKKGFLWSGLYKHFNRVSCFCCPLQSIPKLRTLRREFPSLWNKLLEMDKRNPKHNHGFKDYESVHDFEKRFKAEDRQLVLF